MVDPTQRKPFTIHQTPLHAHTHLVQFYFDPLQLRLNLFSFRVSLQQQFFELLHGSYFDDYKVFKGSIV